MKLNGKKRKKPIATTPLARFVSECESVQYNMCNIRDRAKQSERFFLIYIVADWIVVEPIKIQCILFASCECVCDLRYVLYILKLLLFAY